MKTTQVKSGLEAGDKKKTEFQTQMNYVQTVGGELSIYYRCVTMYLTPTYEMVDIYSLKI